MDKYEPGTWACPAFGCNYYNQPTANRCADCGYELASSEQAQITR